MQNIKKYANARGVRIILEIDSPSHAGAGWEWGESESLGNLAVCVNQQPWREFCIQPPCGQLNPVNPNTFNVLRNIYKQLLTTFGRHGMMHLGGDEVRTMPLLLIISVVGEVPE
jgi:hexosaminidase